ncbi:ester cyclase [Streptomyces platensis]|uniref:ester cyclase n=1 Tax=Streptomyces platensis TaxID=58346 RepID=UPI0036794C41
MSSSNAQLIHDYAEVVWNQGRTDQLGRFMHEDVRAYGLGGEPPLVGLAKLTEETARWRSMYSEATMNVVRTVAEEERVAWQWQLIGTIADLGMLMPNMRQLAREVPQIRQISVDGMSISTIRDGKIAEEVTQSDIAEFLKQIGYPTPQTPQDGSPAA